MGGGVDVLNGRKGSPQRTLRNTGGGIHHGGTESTERDFSTRGTQLNLMKKYCYWSVATGRYADLMERCVGSARANGVFADFHVLTDRPIAGCECYDAYEVEKESGLFQFYYLKLGMAKLSYEYFIWLDADSVFARNPLNILDCLGHAPMHVPLEFNLEEVREDNVWQGMSLHAAREGLKAEGVLNAPYFCENAFWVVHHDAIELVYDLAVGFHQRRKEAGAPLHIAAALGYAMQVLCGDPERHLLRHAPELWASGGEETETRKWRSRAWSGANDDASLFVRPAILHLGARQSA